VLTFLYKTRDHPRNLSVTTIYFYWSVMSLCETLFIDIYFHINSYEFETAQHAQAYINYAAMQRCYSSCMDY